MESVAGANLVDLGKNDKKKKNFFREKLNLYLDFGHF